MLVGNSVGDPAHSKPPGVYYSLSDDLLNWTNADLLMEAEITWVRDCVLPDPIKEFSLLDPASTSRNFETVGQTAQQFYTWYHMSGCNGTLDRDMVRIPIQFSNQQPGGPVGADDRGRPHARGRRGRRIRRLGLRRRERLVEKYRVGHGRQRQLRAGHRQGPDDAPRCSPSTKQVTVTVRVTDDDGKFTDDTAVMKPRRAR